MLSICQRSNRNKQSEDDILLSATTLSMTTLSIIPLSIMTLNIMTLSIMTLSIMALSIRIKIRHSITALDAQFCYAECRLC
jgi:hypothetical protein